MPGDLTDVGKTADVVEALLEAGHSVFVFDYLGVGKSTGRPSFRGFLASGLAVYDYLHDVLGYEALRICIYGASLGGWTAAYVSRRRDHVDGALVLQSTGDDMVAIGKLQHPILRLWPSFLFFPRLSNVTLVRKNHRRYFGIHGQLDDWTFIDDDGKNKPGFPIYCGEALWSACNPIARAKFTALPNSSHHPVWKTDSAVFQAVMREVLTVINCSGGER